MSIYLQKVIDKCSKRIYHINRKAQNEQKGDGKMLSSVEAERVRNRMTKEELAKKLGVSSKTYYNWVNEETDMPISFLIKMSNMFGTTTDYLLKGADGAKEVR